MAARTGDKIKEKLKTKNAAKQRKNGAKTILEELEKILIEKVVPVRKDRKVKREHDKYRQRTKPH